MFTRAGQPLWHCIWGRGPRGNRVACSALCRFSVTSPCYPQSNWALLVLILGGWVCVCSRTLCISRTNSPVRLGVSLTTVIPTDVFNQRLWGFISPHWDPGLHHLSHSLVVHPSLSAQECGTAQSKIPCLTGFSSRHLAMSPLHLVPISTPPSGLDEYFFFNSLVVGLLYSSIFWQLWLSFVFKFVVVLLVVRGGTVYLPMPPSWPEVSLCFSFNPENNSSTVILLPTTFYRWENWSAEWLRHRPQTQYTAVRLGPQAIWLQGPGSKDSITHLSAATVSYRVGYILYSASRISPGISGVGNWKQYHFLTLFEP